MNLNHELINAISLRHSNRLMEGDGSLSDWLYAVGKGSEALLYSILYMPKLELVGGSVLLGWNLPDPSMKEKFLSQLKPDNRESLEASYNFVEIGYLFDAAGRDTSDEEDDLLAALVRDAWESWLCFNYPDRKFIVETLTPEQTGSTVGVHFYEQRAVLSRP